MNVDHLLKRLRVLLLYDLDPSWTPAECGEVLAAQERLTARLAAEGYRVEMLAVVDRFFADRLAGVDPESCLFFNWCEGIPGIRHSEWMVARALEEKGFVFTGSGSDTLALSYQKHRVKRLLAAGGIPTPPWRLFDRPPAEGAWERFPAIVKPAVGHCSDWVTSDSVVMDAAELRERVETLLAGAGIPALVEEFIDGREFHVSLWGNGTIRMLPPAEMDFAALDDIRDRLCTYDAKFTPGSRAYEAIRTLLPAPLASDERDTLERICRAAYRAVGCRDYGRLDVRLRDGTFYVLDVNPNPDISEDASMASAAEAEGYSHAAMAQTLIRLAGHRHPALAGRPAPAMH